MIHIETPRLLLRDWYDADSASFAAMNADPQVMRYFPAPLSTQESDRFLMRIRQESAAEKFGLWAVEERETGQLLGFTGLHRVLFSGMLHGKIEIGWRLRHDAWGHGYASEAARGCLGFAWEHGLEEIVSFTFEHNLRSQRVMQRIGMQYVKQFDLPALPAGHPLLRHVLYRIAMPGL